MNYYQFKRIGEWQTVSRFRVMETNFTIIYCAEMHKIMYYLSLTMNYMTDLLLCSRVGPCLALLAYYSSSLQQ
jgi:hypothetical protein